ncbi:MAG: cell wall hydrolase [Clostridia bacterium]|nr:cell wall hydrolase [Clostridia bacterium]MDD4386876.1 cell wall hydrolase [Clostridia bacterium]
MLSRNIKDTRKKTRKDILIIQRRIILVLLTLLTILIFTFLTKTVLDISKQNRAKNIIASAQNEASQILYEAENNASIVTYIATRDANQKSDDIIKIAKANAEIITETAKVEADKIIDEAINVKIDEVETLLAITEAEAGNQSVKGKAAVAATIKNRIKSNKFKADTIKEVVYSTGQFDPVSNGKIESVTPSASTVEAVRICLEGRDYSNGALYFYNPTVSRGSNARWFNSLQTTTIIGDHVFKK